MTFSLFCCSVIFDSFIVGSLIMLMVFYKITI